MTLMQIGSEQWDFIDADGVQTILPPADAKAPAVTWPKRWRIFGPLKARADIQPLQIVTDVGAAALIERLTSVPNDLTIDGETYAGRDTDFVGDTLDLQSFCDTFSIVYFDAFGDTAARVGHQVYALAQMELAEPTEVPFGAGADFFMQWWIDGKPVYDSLSGGNLAHPPSRTDHTFCCKLSAGRHLLAVRLIAGQYSWVLHAGVLTPREQVLSRITVSDRWQFLPDFDEIRPPYRAGAIGQAPLDWQHTMAIAADRCLADETIECDFQMTGEGNFGVILGAQDSGRYYTVQIPTWGQLWRARAYWACICKADGSGYLRHLDMKLMPHVITQRNRWHHLKVERRGSHIRTWIDGVNGPQVVDDTYGPGRVGITGFTKYTVRNLKIDGRAVDGPAWKSGDFRGRPWFLPVPSEDKDVMQNAGELLRLADDEILMVFNDHRLTRERGADPRINMLLSRDHGRTWQRHGKPPLTRDVAMCMPWGLRWFVPRPGVIRAFELASKLIGGAKCPSLPDDAMLAWRESEDKGLTWSPLQPCKTLGDWKQDIFRDGTWNHVYGGTRLADGTLLMLVLHGFNDLQKIIPNRGPGTWGTECAQPYVSRSQDDGATWSQPVPMDDATIAPGRRRRDGPHGGFSETVFAQLPGGRVVTHCRPFAAPFMWRTHSDDGGKTWAQVTYEPFSGAGGPQLLCTRSGYLVSVKRGPALCMHISTDGGVNWDEGTMIDFPASFNGMILEVEPDVVLVVYPESMGEIQPSFVRAQLIRITPEGSVPVCPLYGSATFQTKRP